MSIQKYEAFVKVIELGSISKAAEALNYAQSGISRMINDLEGEWGILLCERSRHGVKLTSDGLKIFPSLKRIADEHRKLKMQLDDLHGLESGLIRIGTFSSVATHWLPKIIKAYKNDYPGIEFEILLGDYTEIEQWIAEGRVDFGFLRLPTTKDFETIPLAKDRLLVVLPEDHPYKDAARFPVEELENFPYMLLEKGGRGEIAKIFETHDLKPNVAYTTWDDYAIMAMVEEGLGISILPELIMKRANYRIVKKELSVPAYREIGIALRKKEWLSLASRRFLAYFQETFIK